MILASVHTGNFEFTALDQTEEGAKDALILGWVKHCDQYPGAEPGLMAEIIHDGDVNLSSITPGVVLRDGSPV